MNKKKQPQNCEWGRSTDRQLSWKRTAHGEARFSFLSSSLHLITQKVFLRLCTIQISIVLRRCLLRAKDMPVRFDGAKWESLLARLLPLGDPLQLRL